MMPTAASQRIPGGRPSSRHWTVIGVGVCEALQAINRRAAMKSEIGTLYRTDGGASWVVIYRVEMTAEPDGDSIVVTGEIEFSSGTGLRTNNRDGPLYLHLSDGLWAKLYLSEQGSDGIPYTITAGSQLIGRPMWAVAGV
jgi:hypothetical protein